MLLAGYDFEEENVDEESRVLVHGWFPDESPEEKESLAGELVSGLRHVQGSSLRERTQRRLAAAGLAETFAARLRVAWWAELL